MSFRVLVWQCEVRRWQKEGTKQNGNNNNEKKKSCHPSISNFTLYAHHCFVVYSSSTCSWVRCCSSNLFDLSVLSPPLSVFHLLQVSVCLIEMPSSESSCVLDRCYQDRVIICTHTHYSLSCRALCPDCVNPLCPPHISLHPSTSTPLWWRHTHTHVLLSIIIIVSAGEESALLFVITGVWSEREEFSRREKRMDGKEKKRNSRSEKNTHQYVCDILVTFYRNCCSTPSHTCKKKRNTLGMCFAVEGFQGFVWCVSVQRAKELCGWLVWL